MGNNCTKTVQIFPITEHRRSYYSSSHMQKCSINDEKSKKKHYYSNNIFQSNPNLINMVEHTDHHIHRQQSVHVAESEYKNHSVQKSNELNSRQFSEILNSYKKDEEKDKEKDKEKEIQHLNTNTELIEKIIKQLMITKIMIDGCTYHESRNNYSVVPFVYID